MRKLYIYLDQTPIGEAVIENTRGRERWMFRFDPEYVSADKPLIDPDLMNVLGPQFPPRDSGFGFFSDIAPDRWGRKLIRRREKRPLLESDYILGVCDLTRPGALRIKADPTGPFLSAETKDAAPPWTTLRRLENAARNFESSDGNCDERWIEALFRPGSSLGGARPKANVTAPDGSLWIAKFPSIKDEWDVGALEYKTSILARNAGLNIPETKAQKLSSDGTTFFSKRFDRDGDKRIHYASAMTMLGASDGEDFHSYLEIAEFISLYGATPESDLPELWSRIAFSQLVHNTDDHLRNHGFLLTKNGWRLSPMFDVNPNPNGGDSALEMGDIFKDADYYRMSQSQARERYDFIKSVVSSSL